ncbi:hypothetical protein TTHERM_00592770 (macronuclear) [Tetrahymena thermophila SB210]|uniref:AMP-binding enzyme family protein n=1 Tax=Tetrahymena thermophila (strain SB210) TaxID=312017 RepID=Q232M1_TETTS|nr:hypothetical protein TTHERM_00592770 [Tetrahymena thermophila SB210]EAR91391.2 hypothetical protein TTHERM_00592770 [Tetrahymena thermophila SB210]|eukprot:XP_001011636.2 hypothetical protein TTHERM_00592770 [Tetrahymena thermophila SB210]
MNLTYIVPLATMSFKNQQSFSLTHINIIKCSMPELTGYYCLDYTELENKYLELSSNQNIFSSISIYIYSCQVIDNIKSFVPNNCANQTDINNLIDGNTAQLNLKIYTQQYNITSKQYQVGFKNEFMYTQSNQYFLHTVKAQNQITKVKDGFIIQSEQYNSSPINYEIQSQVFSNSNDSPYLQVNLQIDEAVFQVLIQFATFPEILALVNSAFNLLIMFGFFCKRFSQKAILKDLIQIFRQNMHQSCCKEFLNQSQILQQNGSEISKQANLEKEEEILEDKNSFTINVPNFMVKSKENIEVNQTKIQSQNITVDIFSNFQDEILETNEENQQINQKQKEQQAFKFKGYQQNQNIQLGNIFQDKLSSNITTNKSFNLNQFRRSPIIKQNQDESNISKFKHQDNLNNEQCKQFFNQQQKEKFQNYRESCQQEYKFNNTQQNFQLLQNDCAITRLYSKKSSNSNIISPKSNERQVTKNQADFIFQSQDPNIDIYECQCQKVPSLQEENKKFSFGNLINRFILKTLNCKQQKGKNNTCLTDLGNHEKEFLYKYAVKYMDIQQLFKDIIFLKKSIMILLTKEQLAAIKLVGYSSNYIEQIPVKNQQKEKKSNYFEKQLDILNSIDLQSKYLQKFIKKYSLNKSLDIVDQRILSSINFFQKP